LLLPSREPPGNPTLVRRAANRNSPFAFSSLVKSEAARLLLWLTVKLVD